MAAKKKATRRKARPRGPELAADDPFTAVEHPVQRAFLLSFCECGTVVGAADAAGCSPRIHYTWLENEAPYRDAFELAQHISADQLEAVAVRRAREGLAEPVIHQGRLMGRWLRPDGSEAPVTYNADGSLRDVPRGARFEPLLIPRRSDSLLRFLLAGQRPEKYAPRLRGELSGPGGGPIGVTGGVMLTHGTMSEEEWEREHGQKRREDS